MPFGPSKVASGTRVGTTFVYIGEHGFWMRDGILEVWLRLLALHIEESPAETFVGRRIRDQWLLASRGYFMGCVPHLLEEAVSTEEGRAIVVRTINSLMGALKKAPTNLDFGTLNLLGMEGIFLDDLGSKRFLEVGQAFLDLIEGNIHWKANSTDFMPGCRP